MFDVVILPSGNIMESFRSFDKAKRFVLADKENLNEYQIKDQFSIDLTEVATIRFVESLDEKTVKYPYITLCCINVGRITYLRENYPKRIAEAISEIDGFSEDDRITIQRLAIRELVLLSGELIREKLEGKLESIIYHTLR